MGYKRGLGNALMDVPSTVRVTVLVDGIPEEKTLDTGKTAWQVVSDALPADQQDRAGDYDLSLKDEPPLDPASTLADDGIQDGSVLAITKKDGGGGECDWLRQ